MDSVAIRPNLVMALTVCLSVAILPAIGHAQSDETSNGLLQIAATKSAADAKPPIDESHPLFKLLEIAYKARAELDSVDDYKCIFSKRELLRGNRLLKTTMNLKLREKPFSVYLNFLDQNQGREVIYVAGRNDNKLLVHEGGFKSALGTFQIVTTGPDAMADNRYPVTSIGLRTMIDTVIKQWETEGKFDGITPQKRTAKLPTGEACTAYEAVHQPFKEFKFHTTRLYIDDKTGIAIGVQQYAFPGKHDKEPPLAEEYFYGQLKTNVKLTDADFDPRNPTYAFK
jgi:hypothetical protein